MRRIVMVALLVAACGGGGSDAPACTAGAVRCSASAQERCWDPNGAGDVQWHTTATCTESAPGGAAFTPCLTCTDGALDCYRTGQPSCTTHGGVSH